MNVLRPKYAIIFKIFFFFFRKVTQKKRKRKKKVYDVGYEYSILPCYLYITYPIIKVFVTIINNIIGFNHNYHNEYANKQCISIQTLYNFDMFMYVMGFIKISKNSKQTFI